MHKNAESELEISLKKQQVIIENQACQLSHLNMALLESQNKYKKLYDDSSVVHIILDSNFIIQNLNRQAYFFLDIKQKEPANKDFLNYLTIYSKKIFQRHITQLFLTKIKETCEIEFLLRDDITRHAIIESKLLDNSDIHLLVTDITKLHQLELKTVGLTKSLELVNNLFQNVNEAVAFLDSQLYFIVFNKAFVKKISILFATKMKTGMNLLNIISDFPDYKIKLMEGCEQALLGTPFSILIEQQSKNEELNYSYEIRLKAFCNSSDKPQGLLFIIRNITEYKLHERQQFNIERTARINVMGEMVSALAHEISQPLTAIIAYSRGCLLKMAQTQNNDLKLPLEQIAIQAEHAGEIMHSMKKFMREGTLYREYTNINALIEEALSFLHYELLDFKLKISLNLTDNIPKIMVDKIQIIQVILNLARNSIEALQASGNSNPELKINTGVNNSEIIISFHDNGLGIPDEHLDKILKSYFTTKKQGAGLGLSICRSLVEAHGGKLWLERSIAGFGAKFNVSLPID